jgi:hypothetical protein
MYYIYKLEEVKQCKAKISIKGRGIFQGGKETLEEF